MSSESREQERERETHLQNGLTHMEETQIEAAILEIRRISELPSPSPPHSHSQVSWDERVRRARTAIAMLEDTGFMQYPDRSEDRTLVVSSLQRLAYHDADGDGIPDIAEWCTRQWLAMLQTNAEDIAALQGLGQAWLARSQAILARIHRTEGSSSSASSGRRPTSETDNFSYSYSAEAARDEIERAAADARAHTADYVEARGMLIPAVDYFTRAVDVAERRGRLSGTLLSEVSNIPILTCCASPNSTIDNVEPIT
ncbi:hypothetical protein A1O3_06194 [Capronia epimyces CBS 606.96]|uniref:Uncharacterized protein n=1 Tax=Capronia epimyces CBS 606.96 TaxID=1182542 RepID=W9XZK8_9EURO|nr:uncharacterized protein A1O3_06194 [Capronia epimyces CBS 606.96]EXJ82381.1 hypothetical protein A1O3_06194 [Capronia epimyces CBS 606.96]